MKSIKLFILIMASATLSYAAKPPRLTSGWSDGLPDPKGRALINSIVYPRIPQKIDSLAIGINNLPWITTDDGHVLRLRGLQWEDVSNRFSSGTPTRSVKFKHVASHGYTGNMWAIDEDGQIYRWDNAGRGNEEDN